MHGCMDLSHQPQLCGPAQKQALRGSVPAAEEVQTCADGIAIQTCVTTDMHGAILVLR